MTTTLAISTCGPQLEVALSAPSQATPSLVRLAGISPRSTLLLAAAELLVEDAGLEPSAIERVVVSRGPGSFTGIRAGLATAAGVRTASGAEGIAYDSLTVQAARCAEVESVWAAQPGRRGEVYARRFRLRRDEPPEPEGDIEILKVDRLGERTPWIAAESLDLGDAQRATPAWSTGEALLRLADQGVPPQPMEPLYVEGPPIHQGRTDG
jgi:tRNA threonylcarbamoyladenosine biosynthesis protein TsaB